MCYHYSGHQNEKQGATLHVRITETVEIMTLGELKFKLVDSFTITSTLS